MKYNYTNFTLPEAPGLPKGGMFSTTVKQKDGHGLFYCTSILGDKKYVDKEGKERGVSRTTENVKLVTCVLADFDNPLLYKNVDSFIETTLMDVEASIPIAPTRIVRTAKGLHYTWDFVEALPPSEELQELYDHIPGFVGCDPACKDFVRVLRVPGSFHWKTGKPIEVKTISECEDNVYTLDEIKKAFCFVPQEEKKRETKEVNKDSIWFKYNNDNKYSFHDILTEAGWKIWDEKRKQYTRPGKDEGNSGNLLNEGLDEFFYSWTSSDSRLKAKTVYSKSWLLCNLKFNGNKSDTQKYLQELYPEITDKQTVEEIPALLTVPMPEFCLQGTIGELTRAFGELEFPNLVTSLLMAGAAIGKVNYTHGMTFVKPSLYTLLIGKPASGKSSRVEIAGEVFQNKIYDVYPGGSPESGQALVRICSGLKQIEVETTPVNGKPKTETKSVSTPNHQTIFAIDEFYSCIRSASAASSTLLEKMRSGHMARSLTTTSLSNQRDLGVEYVLTAMNPYIYIVSGITSEELQSLIKGQNFESGGLASRFIFANTVQKQTTQEEELYEDLQKMDREEIHRLCEQIKNTQRYSANIFLNLKDIVTREVIVHNDLMRIKYGFALSDENGDVSNRVQQNVYAIAIIYMRADGREQISFDDIEAGWWICRRSIDIYNYHRNKSEQVMAEDKQDSNKVAIRSLIIEAITHTKEKESTLNEIRTNPKHRRKFSKMTPEKIKAEVDSLVGSGDLKKEEKEVGGRKRLFYSLN